MKRATWTSFVIVMMAVTGCSPDPQPTGTDGGRPDAPVQRCSFENCAGCCDGDRCVINTDVDLCGARGVACGVCNGNETCAAGQCVPVADCSNCDGCCLNGTQCLPGDSAVACGSGGAACAECASGTGCNADSGTCEALACDASNCSGCCTANGACLAFDEQTTGACGNAGEACGTCSAGASACTQGTCVVDQPCLEVCTDGCCTASGQCIPYADQSASQCGGDSGAEVCGACSGQLSCVQGGCVADLAWRVSIVSAVIASTKNGEAWDQTVFTNPLPDPYAGLALGNDTFLDGFSPKIDNTLTPNWNHAFGNYLQSDLVSQGLSIVIRDSDGLGVFETIGSCTAFVTAQNIAAGSVTKATCGYASNVVITFTHP